VSSAIDHTSTVFNVDPQAEKAWQRWARGQAITLAGLRVLSYTAPAAAEKQCLSAIQQLMTTNPALGDKFVEIRSEAVKLHSTLR
jgi:hypothetical protein